MQTSFKELNCCSLYNTIEVGLLNPTPANLNDTPIPSVYLQSLYKNHAADSLKNKNLFHWKYQCKKFLKKVQNFNQMWKIVFLEGNIEYLNMSILQILMEDINKNSEAYREHFFVQLIH